MQRLPDDECLIGLGGNVGDVPARLRLLLPQLAKTLFGTLLAVSDYYETEPVGGGPSGVYVNAAVRLRTPLGSAAILARLMDLETRFGRRRDAVWAARTVDLDLLLHGERSSETPRLLLPHPACWYRRFVLDPVCDIAPEVRHPRWHVSYRDLRERLVPRPLPVYWLGTEAQNAASVVAEFADVDSRFELDTAAESAGLVMVDASVTDTALPEGIPRIELSGTDVIRDTAIPLAERARFVLQAALDVPQRRSVLGGSS